MYRNNDFSVYLNLISLFSAFFPIRINFLLKKNFFSHIKMQNDAINPSMTSTVGNEGVTFGDLPESL